MLDVPQCEHGIIVGRYCPQCAFNTANEHKNAKRDNCIHGVPLSGYCFKCDGDLDNQQKVIDGMKAKEAPLRAEIQAKCNELAEFLIEKNKAYGNSAAEPTRIFAKGVDPLIQLDVRIDDKLNRLAKGGEYPGDDTVKDLAGYLILRMIIAEQIDAKQEPERET